MKSMKELIEQKKALEEEKWSADVETNWSPPDGFFKQSAEEIASSLMSASKDLAQAMQRLNFYINRAGDNLSTEDKAKLEAAKKKLSAMGTDDSMAEAMSGVEDNKWNPKYKYSSKEISALTANAQMNLEKALQTLKKAYANGRPEEMLSAVALAIGGIDPLVTVFAGSDIGGTLMTLGHKLFKISKKAKNEDIQDTMSTMRALFESGDIYLNPKTGLIDFNHCNELTEAADKGKILGQMEKMTQQNDHVGARIAGAEYLGSKKLVEQYKLISQLHKIDGSLHPALGKYRDYIDDILMSLAKQNLNSVEYDRFRSAL